MKEKPPIQSAHRIFQVLEYLADNSNANIRDLVAALDLNKSTVHRLLASLISMDYVAQSPESGKYHLTPKIIALSRKLLSHMDYLPLIHPHLAHLAEKSGETVHLVQRSGTNIVYLSKIESPALSDRSIRMASQVGLVHPMYCSGVGKAILSTLPRQEIRSVWEQSEIIPRTPNTITRFDDLLRELNTIRLQGYAVDREENELGVCCVATEIPNLTASVQNAISISLPANGITQARIAELAGLLLSAREQLCQTLGAETE